MLFRSPPFLFQLFDNRPALRLNVLTDFVGPEQIKTVSVHIAKGGKCPAPKLRLRRMQKTHTPAEPQTIGGINILSNKSDLGWPPD